jgi:hypothetical protein
VQSSDNTLELKGFVILAIIVLVDVRVEKQEETVVRSMAVKCVRVFPVSLNTTAPSDSLSGFLHALR